MLGIPPVNLWFMNKLRILIVNRRVVRREICASMEREWSY